MNSAPIALRLASGSVTPLSFSRKRVSASTATSGTLKVSRNALITCSPSSLRIRPWSTNTHVSWSPIARCTSSAATEESTPPESPQIDAAVADLRADAARSVPRRSTPPTRSARSRRPRSGSASGSPGRRACARPRGETGCRRCRARVSSTAATGEALEEASAVKPGGGSNTVSRWDIQQVCSRGMPSQQHAGLGDVQVRAAELADLGLLDAPAELVHEQLHAVADAHHRHAQLEQLALQRAARPRAYTEAGPPERMIPRGLRLATSSSGDVVRQQLAEHAAVAHAAGDQLASTDRRSRAPRPPRRRRRRDRVRRCSATGSGRP